MSLIQTGPIIFGSTEAIVAFLRRNHLLVATKTCTRQVHTENNDACALKYSTVIFSCNTAMRERKRRDVSDGICWFCPTCKTTKGIRDSSFFSKSRLPLNKWMIIIYWWTKQYPVNDCMDEAEVDRRSAIYRHLPVAA